MTRDVLVIGYGNTLRTDDGVGRLAAERLADDPRLDGVRVISRHQLTPDLAVDLSRAALVVFVDASHGPPAGMTMVEPLGRPGRTAAAWSHHLHPSSLVDLAGELYGASPDAVIVRMGVGSLAPGDRLSPMVEAALPGLVDTVAALIVDRTATRGAGQVAEHGRA